MKYPKHNVYEELYAKYLDPESLKILMDLAGEDMTGKRVMDVCGGTGICTEEALRRNAKSVMLIDGEADMVPHRVSQLNGVTVFIDKVRMALTVIGRDVDRYDVAVCRQGINYWFNAQSVALLASLIRPGGVFIFNTFNTRPSETPKIKQYHHRGVSFTEISYVDPTNMVHHVQIREGMAPHVARFQWIAPESFDLFLGKYFDIEKTTRNRTDYYRCVKKMSKKKKIDIDIRDDGEAIEIKGIEPGKEVEAIPDVLEELQSMLGFLEEADDIVDKENKEGYDG